MDIRRIDRFRENASKGDGDGRGGRSARARGKDGTKFVYMSPIPRQFIFSLGVEIRERESWKFSHPKLDGEKGETRWERYKSVSSVLCQIRSSCL